MAGYLLIRIVKIKKDSRFDQIRNSWVEFGKFWLLQALAVWIITLPTVLFFAQVDASSLSQISILGLITWLTGLLIEAIADQQKFNFKNQPKNKNKWTDVGLWQYARYPNYFGEMLCWCGVFLFCAPAFSGWQFASIAGPVFITCLLLFVSGVPPLEKRYAKKYGKNKEYQQYAKRTRLLVPVGRG